ncbi:response regulator [Candidatus Uhrbacteria bacterium]|nr:response regulator [Candidatus Uhrbacteria bacterium]
MTKASILYVDDLKILSELIGELLTEAGYEVILFNNLAQAKRHHEAHDREIDLVLCDGSIQDRHDGHKWAAQLQADGVKTIVLSTEEMNGVPFVNKESLNEDLLPKIEEVLGTNK